jgi:glycine reductase complex component B subunit alpha and beta
MRLELATFPVSRVTLNGGATELRGTELFVNRERLRNQVASDVRFADVSIELVEPGESARVVHFCDAIEPRIKVAGPGVCYPGLTGSVETVGSGRTHRLGGVAVVLSAEYPSKGTGVGAAFEAVLDMSGPGALSPLSRTTNVVVAVKFAPGYGQTEYHEALRNAGFKIARALAEVTAGQQTEGVQTFDLIPAAGLPRVVHIHELLTHVSIPVPYLFWYGRAITDWMPFWAHPNEFFDGALLPNALGAYSAKPSSWEHVNNPVIQRLYAEHGKTLDFAGVIVHRTRFETFEEKQLSANQAAKLAQLMGAQGAIITWTGAGNAFIEGMLTTQALERMGIKTVFMTYEHGGKDGTEAPLMFTVPEANAIVSLGSLDRRITLPAVKRVVGDTTLNIDREAGPERVPADGELKLDWYLPIASGLDHWGAGTQICNAY